MNESAGETLRAHLPEGIEVTETHRYRRDWWPLAQKREVTGEQLSEPFAVVAPRSTNDVVAAVAAVREAGLSLVPYGLGSGVVGGAQASPTAVTVTTDAMTDIIGIDEIAQTVTVQAGRRGSELEDHLNERGYTLGHYPQSIALSSVGGWVATRASGTFSSKYGNIEDLVRSMVVVLPDGEVVRIGRTERCATGPDLRHLFLGSEGAFGIVCELELAIHRMPERRSFGSYSFDSLADGLTAVRELMQRDLAPSLCRLYDEAASARILDSGAGGVAVLLAWDGPAIVVEAMMSATASVIGELGGTDTGPASAESWFERRFDVSHLEAAIAAESTIGDTVEVSTSWPHALELHDAMQAVYDEHSAEAGCHFSHVYLTGTSLYWTFYINGDPSELQQRYLALWSSLMDTTIALGANISHHHGLGRVRAGHLRTSLPDAHDVLSKLKAALDPTAVCNPGALGLGSFPDS